MARKKTSSSKRVTLGCRKNFRLLAVRLNLKESASVVVMKRNSLRKETARILSPSLSSNNLRESQLAESNFLGQEQKSMMTLFSRPNEMFRTYKSLSSN